MRRSAAVLTALAAACVSGETSPRYGFGIGSLLTSGTLDREHPDGLDPQLELSSSLSGFGEILFEGEDADVGMRVLGAEDVHEVEGNTIEAETTQVMGFAMISRSLPLFDGLAFRPSFGLGLGWTRMEFVPPVNFGTNDGATAALALGIELEIARHATLGAMSWYSIYGEPGDTEGDTSNVLLYAGVRF